MMKLFYHEAMRQYADKILMKHDLQWFMDTLHQVCIDNFDFTEEKSKIQHSSESGSQESKDAQEGQFLGVNDNARAASRLSSKMDAAFPITKPELLWFSIMNDEAEGYYFQIDLEKTELLVDQWLDKYNESQDRQRISLIQYDEIRRHILKILRAINMHDGHLITVGLKGFGLQIITKLACFISNIQYCRMEMNQNYTDEDWRQDLRKNIVYSASEDKPLAYVCDEFRISDDKWYLDLECLVKSNVCSEITRKPEVMSCLVQINKQNKLAQKALQGMTKDKNKQETAIDPNYITEQKKYLEDHPIEKADLYYAFLKRVKKNFHLIFNFSPSGADFREKMEKHKQLMICSQMIWIQNLQAENLSAIGNLVFVEKIKKQSDEKAKQLQDTNKEQKEKQMSVYDVQNEYVLNKKILQAVIKIYLDTIQFAKTYQQDTDHVLTFTPVFFIRTFKTYQRLLEERQQNVLKIQYRYEKGLKKIKQTIDATEKYFGELASRAPVLQEKQKKIIAIVVDIEEEFNKVRLFKEELILQEKRLTEEVEVALQNKNDCQDQLDKIVPLINEAVNSMNQISKYDVAEIRTLPHPPKAIKLVLKAVCILLEVEPITKRNKRGEYKPSYWRAAISDKVLGDPNLPAILVSFDRNKLNTEIMGKVEDILSEADYTYENANYASKAAAGLFRWVKAIRDYYYIFQEMQPRRDALMESDRVLVEKKESLVKKKREIKDIQEQLEGLKIHQEQKTETVNELKQQIDQTITRKKRAEKLLKSLSQERQKWLVCSRMLDSKYETVQGDVVLTACYITLGSGFTAKFRKHIIGRWQSIITACDISVNAKFDFQEMFGDNFKLREWHSNDLPPDHYSTDNALIMNKSKRYAFFIDPDQLAQTWLRKQFKSQNLRFTKMTDTTFRRTIEIAMDLGQIILVENVGEKWAVELESLIKKEISKFGNTKMIKFCRRQLKFDSNFNLILATNLPNPRLDSNILNHVQTINFYVSVEALTQNILSIVVANERPDLETAFNDNTNEAFENIKILKDNEEKILAKLGTDAERIMSDDNLIKCLRESKNSAETVAVKLRKIYQTNQFMQRSRNLYARVALRAANLYFALKTLQKLNPMYQYSLTWFMNVYFQSLQKANMPTKSEVTVDDEEFKLLNNKFTTDERINLLNQVFTQELIRKVTFSVFQEDRQLVTYYISLSVLSAEGLLDPELLAFSLGGSKTIDTNIENPNVLPWLTNTMFAELDALSKIRPFNHENLIEHFQNNPEVWDSIYQQNNIIFSELPNKNLIDFSQFLREDLILPKKSQISTAMQQEEHGTSSNAIKKSSSRFLNLNTASHGELPELARVQSSRKIVIDDQTSLKSGKTNRSGNTKIEVDDLSRDEGKVWTEEEILADEELWRVSDDEAGEEDDAKSSRAISRQASRHTASRQVQNKSKLRKQQILYNPEVRNKEYYDDEETLKDEEEQMHRFLVEQAPNYTGDVKNDNFQDMVRMTKKERSQLQAKERMLRLQIEFCIIRVIRPDLIKKCLHYIVSQIYDFGYNSFETDILIQFIDHDATNSSRRAKGHNTMEDKPKAGKAKPSVSALDKKKKKIDNNVQLLIKEAFKESKPQLPILFLITHSINVYSELHAFHLKNAGSASTKLISAQIGMSLNQKIESDIAKSMLSGDWLLIENLHLAEEWIFELENIIQKFPYERFNPKFRLWLSTVQYDKMPIQILRNSVKISLQQPTGVKLKMERLIEKMEAESSWRRLTEKRLFKNMYISLSYLHSVLDGRSQYGTLGWNIYKGFDSSDFEIGAEQIKAALSSTETIQDKDTVLFVIKYLFANINFSGKITRNEDQRKLIAHIEDLFQKRIIYCHELPEEPHNSHYGYPHLEVADFNTWVPQMPNADNILIYGFNKNIERYVLRNNAEKTLQSLSLLSKTKKAQENGVVTLTVDMENDAHKTSLAKTNQTSSRAVLEIQPRGGETSPRTLQEQMAEYYDPTAVDEVNVDALLPLFSKLQKLIASSSFAQEIREDSDRFDERIDSMVLVQRDKNDKIVTRAAQQILKILRNLFNERLVDKKLPLSNLKKPTHIVFNFEIKNLMCLIGAMIKSLEDLLQHIEGVYQKPIEIERLWHKISNNAVPQTWRTVAFQTTTSTFASFLLEVIIRVKFWQNLLRVNADIPAVWLPAFYDPDQYLNSLVQKTARKKKEMTNKFKTLLEVTDVFEPTKANCVSGDNTSFIFGLWLEGASWDPESRMLVEAQTTQDFEKFPVIKVIVTAKEDDEEERALSDTEELDNPKPTKAELKQQEEIDRINEELRQAEHNARIRALQSGMRSKQTNQEMSIKEEASLPGSPRKSSVQGTSPRGLQSPRLSPKISGQDNKDSAENFNFMIGNDSKLEKQPSSALRDGSPKKKVSSKLMNVPGSRLDDKLNLNLKLDENSLEQSQEASRTSYKKVYTYRCPVFKTIQRLSFRAEDVSYENKPVTYIDLPTKVHPRVWVKRSVALLMETNK